MTTAVQSTGGGGALDRPGASSLADVIDTILDKGLVIDAPEDAAARTGSRSAS
jgi:gas vesicle structural protein